MAEKKSVLERFPVHDLSFVVGVVDVGVVVGGCGGVFFPITFYVEEGSVCSEGRWTIIVCESRAFLSGGAFIFV